MVFSISDIHNAEEEPAFEEEDGADPEEADESYPIRCSFSIKKVSFFVLKIRFRALD
jgi:hypothetical protein